MTEPITSFQGEHRWLSNFWPAKIIAYDLIFSSVETAYVASKTLDSEERTRISKMTPGEAKRYGRSIKLRSDWEEVKLDVMWKLLHEKFSNPELKQKLIDTKDAELIEGNTWGDKFWGVCNGQGLNHLGKLLMEVRKNIISSNSTT